MILATLPLMSIVLIFLISVGTSFMINLFLLKKKHFKINISRIGYIRWAMNPKPTLGGYSFFFIFLLLFIYIIFAQSFPFYLVISLTIAFTFGFLDDNFHTSPFTKMIGQLLVSICFIANDIAIIVSDYQLFNTVFTIFWVVGMMNSINMLDNMDGIVTSVSIITLGIALMIIVQSGNINLIDVILIVGIIGALIGFLFYNWNPAKIYMGDTGSQFLGVFIAAFSIKYIWNLPISGSAFTNAYFVFLVFLIPITDTTAVVIKRLSKGQSPFVGGKDHTTHHLYYNGVSERKIVLLFALISVIAIAFLAAHIFYKKFEFDIIMILGLIFSVSVFLFLNYITLFHEKRLKARQKQG